LLLAHCRLFERLAACGRQQARGRLEARLGCALTETLLALLASERATPARAAQ